MVTQTCKIGIIRFQDEFILFQEKSVLDGKLFRFKLRWSYYWCFKKVRSGSKLTVRLNFWVIDNCNDKKAYSTSFSEDVVEGKAAKIFLGDRRIQTFKFWLSHNFRRSPEIMALFPVERLKSLYRKVLTSFIKQLHLKISEPWVKTLQTKPWLAYIPHALVRVLRSKR